MHKTFLSLGAFYGATAIALGAFGAHGLKKIVSPDALAIFQTGVQYQVYHALALMICAIVYERFPIKWISGAGYLFSFGVIFFSGSLYLVTAFYAYGKDVPTLVGIITPVGGLFFILGWLSFLIGILKKTRS